jgi:outer membrane protein TolC
VLKEAQQTAHAMYQLTQNYFNQGLVQKSDLLNAQVHEDMVTTQLVNAKSNIKNTSDYLSFIMGAPTGTTYTIDKVVFDNTLSGDSITRVPEARADFMAMQKAIEASNLMINSSKMSYLPKLNAFGNYQHNDKSMFGFGANAYLAGVQLSWNLFNGNRTKNTIVTQTLERNKLQQQLSQQKEHSQLELNKTYRDMHDAGYQITQQQSAIQQASEDLRILQNRYEQGLVKTTDVLMAETQLAQQKLGLALAQFNYQTTQAYLQFLTQTSNNTKY